MTLIRWNKGKWHIARTASMQFGVNFGLCTMGGYEKPERREVSELPTEGICANCRRKWEKRNGE